MILNRFRFKPGAISTRFPLFLCVIAACYASYLLRGLYADGAGILVTLINSHEFSFWNRPRIISHFLLESLTLLLLELGVSKIDLLAGVYSFSQLFLPLLLVIMILPIIPGHSKSLFIFPLFYYLAGIMSASFSSVHESQISGCYFSFCLFLILFYRTGFTNNTIVFFVSLPVICMYEGYMVFGPLLFLGAICRWKNSRKSWDSLFFVLLCIVYAVATILSAYFVLEPMDVTNRRNFLTSFQNISFLINGSIVNAPAFLGILVGINLLFSDWVREHNRGLLRVSFVVVCVASLLTAGQPILSSDSFSPQIHWDGRVYVVIMAPIIYLPLIFKIWSGRSALQGWALKSSLILALAMGQCGWHLAATYRWGEYIDLFRDILSANEGLILPGRALTPYPADLVRNFWNMSWGWTNSSLSLLLSPNGMVKAIVGNPLGHEPLNLCHPEVSNSVFDITRYLSAMSERCPR